MKEFSNSKLLRIVTVLEIVIVVIIVILMIISKCNSHLVSPPLSFWQSRFVNFEDGFTVYEGDIESNEFDNTSRTVDLLYGPYMTLPRGGYTYSVEYECEYDQKCAVHAFERPDAVKDSVKTLKATENSFKGHFSVNKEVDNLELRIEYDGKGSLSIKNITIVSGPYRLIVVLTKFILLSVAISSLIIFWNKICIVNDIVLKGINNRYVNNNISSIRYDGIDALKCLAAFMVVNVHMTFDGNIGDLILGICRSAVPVFFIISGFFYTNIVNQKKAIKQIKKVFFMVISSNLLYFMVNFIKNKTDVSGYLVSCFGYDRIKEILLFNDSPAEYHLWYLNALLYVLIILYFAWKIKAEKYLIFISPLLLILGLMLGKYSRLLWNKDISILYSRNFLLEGIPFFAIGMLLYRLLNVIKINYKVIFAGTLLSAVATITEVFILKNKNASMFGDIYISTVFLSIFLVLLFSKLHSNNNLVSGLAFVGRKYSSNIYIIHVLIIDLWVVLYRLCGFNKGVYYFKSIIVFIISLIFVALYDWGLERIKKLRKVG